MRETAVNDQIRIIIRPAVVCKCNFIIDVPETLKTLFSADVEEIDDEYRVMIPKREVVRGGVASGDTYRIAILKQGEASTTGPNQKPTGRKETDWLERATC